MSENLELKQLNDQAKKNAEGLATLTKSVNSITDKLSKIPAPGTPHPHQVLGTPWAVRGEMTGSRGFSFMKMFGVLTGELSPDEAKVEMDVHSRLHNLYVKELGTAGYQYGVKVGIPGTGKFLAPLATAFMQEGVIPNDFRAEMKSLVMAGVGGVDPDKVAHLTKSLPDGVWKAKALSWLNELTGGALVAPPEQGELIELLRNKEALVNAGARTVPLPPQGRLKYPRQTAASNTYWVGENSPITESLVGTGEVTLQGKKLAVLIKAPNELIRFASPTAEALLRDDMTKSLALGLDLACLEGLGGDNRPLGLINRPNINRVNSSTQGANGDTVKPQDVYRLIAAVEESNAEFEGYIMRPKTLYKYYQVRADSISAADQAGPFVFNLIREAGDGVQATIAGYPVTKSTQVSQARTKGTATNLTYVLGGMWSDYLIGMFGAIEFAATTLGDTAFTNDQTWVRGILTADAAPRHEAAFVMMDNLDTIL